MPRLARYILGTHPVFFVVRLYQKIAFEDLQGQRLPEEQPHRPVHFQNTPHCVDRLYNYWTTIKPFSIYACAKEYLHVVVLEIKHTLPLLSI